MTTKTVPAETLTAGWLRTNGYDGLTDGDECGCLIDDLIPCGSIENLTSCIPGHRISCHCGNGCAFHVVTDDKEIGVK